MPPQTNSNQPSPFEIVTPKKSAKGGGRGLVVAVLIVVFLILSVIAGVILVRQQQNIQEKAVSKNPTPTFCPAAQACPYSKDPTLLRVCGPSAEVDRTPDDHPCSQAAGNVGKIYACGASQYCCPSSGASWTTDLTVCNSLASPSPSPTLTPTPTPTSSSACNSSCTSNSNCESGLICSSGSCRNPLCTSASDCLCTSASPTATSTPIAQTTPLPIPVTGVDWPTRLGIGAGAAAIILSILIAL